MTLLPKAIHEGRYTKADHATSKDYPGLKLYAYKIEVPQEPGEGVLPKLWIWREDLEDRTRPPDFPWCTGQIVCRSITRMGRKSSGVPCPTISGALPGSPRRF